MGWDAKPEDKLPHEAKTKKLTGNNVIKIWATEYARQTVKNWYKHDVKVMAKLGLKPKLWLERVSASVMQVIVMLAYIQFM